MTQNEKITLEDLIREFRSYKDADLLWKQKIEEQVKPLVEDRLDHVIVQKYGKMMFKGFVSVLGAIATVLIIFKALADIKK